MKGLPTSFVAAWCVLMPLTSFLLIPSAQGTLPAYVLAFVSVFFVILSQNGGRPSIQRRHYFTILFLVGGIWVLLLCGSQLGLLLTNWQDFGFGGIFMNNPTDTRVVFRSVIFTQTLYLAACLCIALFFRFFFRAEWMRYVLWGGWFLAIYGIYEWVFFLVFQQTGDFIANRTFGEDMRTGSWSQTIQMGPLSLLRIKSTFGEPSFFSAAVIPYLFLAMSYKRKWLSAALFFCTIFSTSTSAFIGLAFALIVYSLFQRKLSRSIAFIILLFAGAMATLYFVFPDLYESMFAAKLSGDNNSGEIHQYAAEALSDTLNTLPLVNRLFGIGFGYSYAAVFNAVLINTGWIGVLVYLYAFLKPIFLLRPRNESLGLKVAISTIFFLYYINVSEFFLPTTWMFLGLAYWQLDRQRQEKMGAEVEAVRTPVPV
jgi:hypothetical protein